MDDEAKIAAMLEYQIRLWPKKIQEMKEMPARFRGGDWQGLAEYLREGGRVTPEIRLALVDALSGVLKQPRRKEKRPEDTKEMIALEVMLARRRGKKMPPRGVQEARDRFFAIWRNTGGDEGDGRHYRRSYIAHAC